MYVCVCVCLCVSVCVPPNGAQLLTNLISNLLRNAPSKDDQLILYDQKSFPLVATSHADLAFWELQIIAGGNKIIFSAVFTARTQ